MSATRRKCLRSLLTRYSQQSTNSILGSLRQQRNQSWTHQGLRRQDERNDETDLQWSDKKSCTPETWRRVRIKVIHKKKEAKKTPGTAAQFVLCQRCTNCSRQLSTTDYAPGLTRYNRKIKAGSVDPTKHWTTWPRADLSRRKAESGVSKCGLQRLTSWRHLNSIIYDSIWKALETCGMEQHCINLVRRLYFNRKATVMTDEESEIFEVKEGDETRWPVVQSAHQHWGFESLKEKSLGICLSDCETRCALVFRRP